MDTDECRSALRVGTACCAGPCGRPPRTPQRGVPTKELWLAKPRSSDSHVHPCAFVIFNSTPHPAPLPSDGRGWRRTLPVRGGEGVNPMRKMRDDSTWDQLTPEQREQLES